MTKRGTSHFRKAEDRRKAERLARQKAYFSYRYLPDELYSARPVKSPYYQRLWLSEQRKAAKHSTNKVCRSCLEIPNYSGYRKLHDYWWDVW
jgi:hypothetical protein